MEEKDLSNGGPPVERVLEIQWNTEDIKLEFMVNLKKEQMKRRSILSIISSIFDPHMLVSPFLIKGKEIFQNLCYELLGWDDNIPDSMINEWEY